MILSDYFRPEHDTTWDFAVASGVKHGVIRLPEDGKFDYADGGHWQTLVDRFLTFGVKPVAIEPMPTDSVKKACPIAAVIMVKMLFSVKLSAEGTR